MEEVFEDREGGVPRMAALADMRELLRVAEKHDGPRAAGHGECVGQGDLTGLVDEEHVDGAAHLGPGPEPRRAGEQLDSRIACGHDLVARGRFDVGALVA
jgi:hypothetical protein